MKYKERNSRKKNEERLVKVENSIDVETKVAESKD